VSRGFFFEVATFSLSSALGLVGLAALRLRSPGSRILEQSMISSFAGALLSFTVIRYGVLLSQNTHNRKNVAPRVGWASIAACLVTILFSWMVLNSIDRSNSFYILKWLGDTDQAMSVAEIESQVTSSGGDFDYLAVETRLIEHERRGIVSRDEMSYSLSWIGKCIYWSTDILAKLFSLSGWSSK
jgi:hypothetical protein